MDFAMKLYIVSISLLLLANSPYAVSAWWGFSSAADRQPLQKVLHRGIRSGLCTPETPTLSDLAESIDDTLFERIMHNPYHVIHHLLPPRRELSYNIRQRHHNRQLDIIFGQLRSRNFILFTACCSRTVINCFYCFYILLVLRVLVQMRSVISVFNKRI